MQAPGIRLGCGCSRLKRVVCRKVLFSNPLPSGSHPIQIHNGSPVDRWIDLRVLGGQAAGALACGREACKS